MSIFQKSIVKKHISSENPEVLKAKWNLFTSYFHNATIQENIHNSKEEQFQEGFLRELFVKVLGYTLNPEPNFNLTTEYKNIKDSKKADGAIIINNTVTAVIELKGTAITDLGKVESQAFNYKNNQHQCLYVITSNFEKLRFYIDNAIEHIEFNLFKLTEEEFQLLYLCLAFKNIENNVPKNIKDESVSQEDVITKKLYNNYSLFKRELHHNLVALNPGNDPLELFQKSQKLLDRFLFIFFAEDRGLLPTNLIFRINKEWQQLREMRIEVSLYDRYKIYFSDLNVGAKVSLPAFSQTAFNKKEEFQIYAYNGGLFKEDDELNTLKIDDELLFKHTEKLSNYDFASEVDVNILGHIFENSLNELDEIKAQIEGQEIDKTKTKRKKDGVFYTPKYITKYIVDNTVGKLCTDKKVEFKILEEEYITDKKRNKTTIQNLASKLSDYRNWLLQITICDPACGSGAFLNQALDFLINEHQYIDELQAKLFGDAIVMSDVEQSILENNIFGVDINEESVEIAKLSLWLRTAQPNRKLNDLNSNIKCGNSLIDDVVVAGDKAFNWELQFPVVFEKGGFDVIIGNPPYVKARDNENVKERTFIEKNYLSASKMWDLYIPFIEKGINILKDDSHLSMIIPDTIGKADYSMKLIELIENKYFLNQIDFFPDLYVFENVGVRSKIIFVQKSYSNEKAIKINHSPNISSTIRVKNSANKGEEQYILQNAEFNINLNDSIALGDICYVSYGMRLNSDKEDPNKFTKADLVSATKDEIHSKLYTEGKFLAKYLIQYQYFLEYNTERSPNRLVRPTFPELYPPKKLLLSRQKKVAAFSDEGHYCDNTIIMAIPAFELENVKNNSINKYYQNIQKPRIEVENLSKKFDLKYLLSIINSKLICYYIIFKSKGNIDFYPDDWKCIPIKILKDFEQYPFIEKADLLLALNKELQSVNNKFTTYFCGQYKIEKLSNKLEQWYTLEFTDFVTELNKAIKTVKGVPLTKKDEFDWIDLFEENKKKALELKSQIDATDKEIDQLVYKLYDLTEEEIAIVEKV